MADRSPCSGFPVVSGMKYSALTYGESPALPWRAEFTEIGVAWPSYGNVPLRADIRAGQAGQYDARKRKQRAGRPRRMRKTIPAACTVVMILASVQGFLVLHAQSTPAPGQIPDFAAMLEGRARA